MKKIYVCILVIFSLFLIRGEIFSQNIAINTSGAANSTLSMLEILQISATANTKGLHITHSGGVAGTGYGLWVEVTGATTKYAIVVPNGSGSVGIGTITPEQNLSVGNGMNIDQANINAGTTTNGLTFGTVSGEGIASKRTATGNQYGLDFYTAFANRMSIANGGYVGINTSSPQGRLDLYTGATATDALYVRSDPGANPWQGGIIHHQSTTYGFKQTVQNTSSATFATMQFDYVNRTSPTTVTKSNILVLEADGNVGIGTLAPSSLLHLQTSNVVDVPRGDIILSRYWASNTDTRASSVFHYYNSTTGNDNLAFGVAGGGGSLGQPNALAQIKMLIQASGYVGIGTTAPGYKLTVTAGGIGGTYGLTPNYAGWAAYGTGDGGAAIYNDNGAYQKLMIVGNTSGGGGVRRVGLWDYLNVNGSGDYTGTLAVGRTTLNPGASLHVQSNLVVGDLAAGAQQTLEVIPAGGDVYVGSSSQEGDLFVRNMSGTANVHFSGGSTNNYILSGSLGIGTSVPQQNLSVSAGMNIDQANVNAGNTINGLTFGSGSGEGIGSKRSAGGNQYGLDFYTAFANRMCITTTGNVGIGTTSPSGPLQVHHSSDNVGTVMSSVAALGYLQFLPGNVNNGSYNNIVADDDNVIMFGPSATAGAALSITPWQSATTGIRIYCPTGSTALVGINRRPTTYALEVAGTIWANGTNITAGIATWSDIRYKKNIKTLENALEKVQKLRGVTYDWRNEDFPDKNFTEGLQIGVIAQEIEKIYPELVMTDKDGYKTVSYEKLTPILIEAVKEQQKVIDSLKSDVSALKAENKIIISDYDNRLKKIEEQLGAKAEK